MDRREEILASLGVILLLGAAIFFLMPEKDDSIKDVRETANQSSYQVNYTVDFNQSLVPAKYNYSSFEAYSDGNRYKNIIRYERNNTYYRNVSFITSEETLRCTEVTGDINYFECELEGSKTSFFYELIDLAIRFSNSKGQIANRTEQCYRFNYSVRSSAVPGAQNITWSPNIETCLDPDEGYVRNMEITGSIMDENGSVNAVELMQINASSINESFEGSAEPDVKMITDANCDQAEPKLKVLVLQSMEDITVTVGGYNESFEPVKYKPLDILLPPSLLVNGTNRFQLYTESGMREITCDISNWTY